MENDAVVLSVSLFRKHIGCGYQGGYGLRAAAGGAREKLIGTVARISSAISGAVLEWCRMSLRSSGHTRKCRCCYQRMISKTVSTPFARRRPDPSRESSVRISLTWRVDREAAIFLGAGRALLLQLAHPWVAAAISEHSRTFADPVGRFHRTFNITFTMVFGTLDQALAASRRLHRRHAAVTGILPQAAGRFEAGSAYSANEVSALRWVHATLVETALQTHDLVLPVLTNSEREQYWAEAKLYAALFGIRAGRLAGGLDVIRRLHGGDGAVR